MEEVVVVVSYPPEPFSLEVLGFESSVWVVGFEVSFWVFAGLIKALLSSQAPSFFAFASSASLFNQLPSHICVVPNI